MAAFEQRLPPVAVRSAVSRSSLPAPGFGRLSRPLMPVVVRRADAVVEGWRRSCAPRSTDIRRRSPEPSAGSVGCTSAPSFAGTVASIVGAGRSQVAPHRGDRVALTSSADRTWSPSRRGVLPPKRRARRCTVRPGRCRPSASTSPGPPARVTACDGVSAVTQGPAVDAIARTSAVHTIVATQLEPRSSGSRRPFERPHWNVLRDGPLAALAPGGEVDRREPGRVGQAGDPAALGDRAARRSP